MHRRPASLVLAGLAAFATALTLSACSPGGGSGQSSHPGEIVWARDSAIDGWEGDQCIANSGPTNAIVFDSLLRIQTPDGSGFAPGLASEWSYDEAAHTYRFVLQDDAAFSNGDPLTADDVVFSFEEWKAGPINGVLYSTVDTVTAVSDSEVEVVMTGPDTFLPALLTWCNSTIYPVDFAGMDRDEYFAKPIGAGPFAVESWSDPSGSTESITLVPNEHFWGWGPDGPTASKLTIEAISDANQRALQFQSGAVDILEKVDEATAAQLDADRVVYTDPAVSLHILTNTVDGPASDPLVRAAISKAIDRDAIAAALGQGTLPATGILAPSIPGMTEPTEPYSFDLDEAQALMAQSGSPDGLSIGYLYDVGDREADVIAQILVTQLAQIGIDLKLEPTDAATQSSRLADGDFELADGAAGAISPTIFDPIGYMMAVSFVYTGTDTSVITENYFAGTSTNDEAVVEQAVRAIQDDALQSNAIIGVVDVSRNWAAQERVQGFAPLQYRIFYADQLSLADGE